MTRRPTKNQKKLIRAIYMTFLDIGNGALELARLALHGDKEARRLLSFLKISDNRPFLEYLSQFQRNDRLFSLNEVVT